MSDGRGCRAAMLALGLVAAAAPPVRATVVLALSFDDLAVRANRVVLGTVDSVASRWSVDGERIETVVDIAVETEVSGVSAAPVARIVQPGGRIGDVGLWVSGMPRFRVGERVLVFLEVAGTDGDGTPVHRVVGLAQGKFNVLPRVGGGFDAVQDFGAGLALARVDADGMVRPADDARPLAIDLEVALARVRALRGEVAP